MNSDPLFIPSPKQQEFIDAVFSGQYRYLLYGGAIRGGKTYVTLSIIILLCKFFPGSRWAIVRKDLPTIRRNVLPVYDKTWYESLSNMLFPVLVILLILAAGILYFKRK